MPKVRVLFVCLGNICRSPMAEAVFADKVKNAGLQDLIEVDSAGTGSWHTCEPPHTGTVSILRNNNIDCSHRARTITKADLADFDYIFTMDDDNYRDIVRMGSGKAKVIKFLSLAPQLGVTEVPDPWYDGNFQRVYDLVAGAATALLEKIRFDCSL